MIILKVYRVVFIDGSTVCMAVRDESDIQSFCSAWTDKPITGIEKLDETSQLQE